jgi:hypothetical protein
MPILRLLFSCALLVFSTLAAAADKGTAGDPDTVGLPKDLVAAPAETLGSVVGTIGYRLDIKPYVDRATIAFRSAGSQELGYVTVSRSHMGMGGNAKALKDGKFQYAAFKIDLPEGHYELVRALGTYDLGSCVVGNSEGWELGKQGLHYNNATDFSVPFEVKRGKVLYLGSFLAHGTLQKGKVCFIPIPVPGPVYFSYADKWQRDSAAFTTGALAVDMNQVEHAQLEVNEHTGYYLIAEDQTPEAKMTMHDYNSGHASFAGKIAAYQAAHPASPTVTPTQSQ